MEERVFAEVSEERQRIAGELHDSVGGTLVGVALMLAGLQRKLPDPEVRATLGGIIQAVEQGMSEIRTLSFGLQLPRSDPDTSFARAATDFAKGFGRRAGLDVHVHVAPDLGEVAWGEELVLFRVLQEALMNVHRHAAATSVHVTLRRHAQTARLTILDDGKGFEHSAGERLNGAGLVAMRSRISRFGGTLEIKSSSRGTSVSACIPLRALSPDLAA
jgi:signal transduction histidine kinase